MSKGKNNKKKVNLKIDRNLQVAWKPFYPVEIPPGGAETGVVAMFENNFYGVMIRQSLSPTMTITRPNGAQEPMPIAELIIIRLDKKNKEIPWSHKQRIKNELLSPSAEALELFPHEGRRMRDIPYYHAHIWALSPGAMAPIGLIPREMAEQAERVSEEMELATVSRSDIEVFVVTTGNVVEVFADGQDAKECYEKAEAEMGSGVVGRIGDVPAPEDGAAWSEKAQAKLANIIDKATKIEMVHRREMGEDADEDGPETIRVNTNGPDSIEDEIEGEMSVGEYAPNSDEEGVMAKEYMAMGVSQIRNDRAVSLREAVSSVEAQAAENETKQAEAVAAAEAEAKAEKEAAADLERMRKEARQKQKENKEPVPEA